MAAPSISVIIPAYRAEHTIERAINSVLRQTVRPTEVIVVDDGSPDRQADRIKKYGSDVRLIRQTNAKTAAARNRGIDHATGDWIAFLDADDYWESNKLARQIDVVRRFPEVRVIGGRSYCQPPDADRYVAATELRAYDQVLTPSNAAAFSLGTILWTGTVMVHRDAMGNERFVSGLEPAEDRDLWIRLAARHPTYMISIPLATAVLEPGGISRTDIERDCQKMLEVIDRHRQLLDPLTRFRWRSYVRYRWAAIEQSPGTAFPLLVRSLLGWPAPFFGMPAMRRWGRLRRLGYLIKHSVSAGLPRSAAS